MNRLLKQVDVAFLALHGQGGEDGTIQRYLNRRKIPYVGSDPVPSERTFDKEKSKKWFVKHSIPTPPFTVINRSNWKRRLSRFKPPYFVKPVCNGSSVGVFCVEDFSKKAEILIRKALRSHGRLLIEKKILGREMTVGILGNEALPVIELIPKRSFYDYRAKYTRGMTRYLVPAPIAKSLRVKLQRLAKRVHHRLGLRDLSRVDVMMDHRDKPYVLEANSIPGMTELSLLPKAARAAGMPFEKVCETLVGWAYKRKRHFKR